MILLTYLFNSPTTLCLLSVSFLFLSPSLSLSHTHIHTQKQLKGVQANTRSQISFILRFNLYSPQTMLHWEDGCITAPYIHKIPLIRWIRLTPVCPIFKVWPLIAIPSSHTLKFIKVWMDLGLIGRSLCLPSAESTSCSLPLGMLKLITTLFQNCQVWGMWGGSCSPQMQRPVVKRSMHPHLCCGLRCLVDKEHPQRLFLPQEFVLS